MNESKITIELNPENITDGSKVVVEFYDIGANITTHDCTGKVCNRYEADEEVVNSSQKSK